MTVLRSALLVVVPEAEVAVRDLRLRLDPAASVGVPAHVTGLYPFLPPEQIDDVVNDRLTSLFAGVRPFDLTLARAAWFGDRVLHLAPEPDAPFRALTRAVWSAFPSCPPYGGEYGEDPDPHLTIANGGGTPADRRAAADTVAPHLPITATARAVTLFCEQASGRWQPTTTFAFHGSTVGGG